MHTKDDPIESEQKKLSMRSDYNDYSYSQKQMFSPVVKYMDLAMEKHHLDNSNSQNVLVIADYGSSTGANSSEGIKMVLDRFRQKYGDKRSIMVIHNDMPENNWSALFNYLNLSEESYLANAGISPHVFALGSGKSFYSQILPDQSLHFGISCASINWLAKLPCKLQNHIVANLASDKEIMSFRKQAKEDWERFLSARSKELVTGGILVIGLPCGSAWGFFPIAEALYSAATRLFASGVITEQELIDFNLPVYFRKINEVSDTEQLNRHGFEIVICENCTTEPSHFYKTIISCKDKVAWATDVANGIMAVIEPNFLQSLSSHRNRDEQKEVCSKLFSMFIDEALKIEPSELNDRTGNVFIVLKKTTET